jgi:hypothetical protein
MLKLLIVFLVSMTLLYMGKIFGGYVPDLYEDGKVIKLAPAVIVSLVLVAVFHYTHAVKEKFFFEVSQPQLKCQKGYRGKNVGFEYTTPGTQEC